MMKLYHGTGIRNIEQLKPIATRGNAISKPVVCFTPNPNVALFYIWNRSYKWVAFRETEDGKVVFTEHYENMLADFYSGVSGSVYECDGENTDILPTHMKSVYTSEVGVPVGKETPIDNVYDEILKQESLGNIIVRRYGQLSPEDKREIFKMTVRAIHMQKLLTPSDDTPKRELVHFVKTHFPAAWETASGMDEAEVRQMIDEWRASLKEKA